MENTSQKPVHKFPFDIKEPSRPRMDSPSWVGPFELGIIGMNDWPVAGRLYAEYFYPKWAHMQDYCLSTIAKTKAQYYASNKASHDNERDVDLSICGSHGSEFYSCCTNPRTSCVSCMICRGCGGGETDWARGPRNRRSLTSTNRDCRNKHPGN